LFRQSKTQQKLNAQITEMVRTQEKTIEERTATLKNTNSRLLELVQFSTHVIREPITRIKSLYMLKSSTSPQEFEDVFNPMIEEAINDLDTTLKEVIKNAEQP
jgi:light-regulated signal transduction histidine kinase (bacteriophytochrome)